MIHIGTMVMVQKLKWFKLYLDTHKCLWSPLMDSLINVKSLAVFLRSNFDMSGMFTKSSFYHEILCILHKLNADNNRVKRQNIFHQFLYYNKWIKIDKKMLFDEDLMHAGIWKISELFDSNRKLIPFETLQQRGLPKSKYMIWLGIINIVRKLDTSDVDICNETFNELIIELPKDEISIQHLNSKDAYDKIIKLKYARPKSIEKYTITFSELENINFENIYLLPRYSTKDNYLKDLQFQILHRYLPTNYLLYKMKKVSSIRCSFCELHVENIPHLFYHCLNVRRIWNMICDVLESIVDYRIILRCQDVIFGFGFESRKWRKYVFINNVISNVKGFIWHIRKCDGNLTIGQMYYWFKERASIDKTLLPLFERIQNLL